MSGALMPRFRSSAWNAGQFSGRNPYVITSTSISFAARWMPWHVAGDHSMIWSARSSRSRISSLELYDDSFRYFKLRLALHPVVTRAVVPEDLALALVRNRKLHVAASKHLLHALQVVGPYRPHAVEDRGAVEGGVGECHAPSGHGGLRVIVDHHAVALSEEAMGYRRPDVADATNQDDGRVLRSMHAAIVLRDGVRMERAGRPAEAASRPGVGYSDLRQLPRLDEVYEDVPLVLLQDREVPSFTDPHFVPGDLDLGARRAGRTQRHLHVLHRLSSFLVSHPIRDGLLGPRARCEGTVSLCPSRCGASRSAERGGGRGPPTSVCRQETLRTEVSRTSSYLAP